MGTVSWNEIRINYRTKSVVISSGEAQNPVSVNLSQPTEIKDILLNTPPQISTEITPKNADIFTEIKDILPNLPPQIPTTNYT
jgi:hypothetical protein